MDFASKVMSPLYCQSFIRSNIGLWTGGPVSRDGRKDEESRAGLGEGACPAGVLGRGALCPAASLRPARSCSSPAVPVLHLLFADFSLAYSF